MPKHRDVPAAALEFCVGQFQFVGGDGGEEVDPKTATKIPIQMIGRSGKPVDHWYWGQVVHDLSGMRLDKKSIPIDFCHRDWSVRDVIGYADQFSTDSGNLELSGALVPVTEDLEDPARQIAYKGQQGVPWEASINFGGTGIVIEEVSAGAEVEVNGYTLKGPAVVVRQWPLRGVAVCPYGVDQYTESKFQDAGEKRRVTIFKENSMSQDNDAKPEADSKADAEQLADKPAEDTKPQADRTDADGDAAGQDAEQLADKPAEDAKPQQRGFAQFAEQHALKADDPETDADYRAAAVWFAEGKTFDEAQSLWADKLKTDRDAANKKLAALNADRGADAAEFQSDDETPKGQPADSKAGKFASTLGENLGGVAAGLKFASPN